MQGKIAHTFFEENGYLEPTEVAGWLRAHGYSIECKLGLDKTPVFVFPSEEDYSLFLLRWS